jgi:hypothetical protein
VAKKTKLVLCQTIFFICETDRAISDDICIHLLFISCSILSPPPPHCRGGAASVLRIHLIYITAAFSIQAIDLFSAPPPFPANQNKTSITNLPSHWTVKYAFLRVFIVSSVENEEPWNLTSFSLRACFPLFHYCGDLIFLNFKFLLCLKVVLKIIF